MLRITIPASQMELWDEKNQEFIHLKDQTLQLEHSLVSLSKWEAKWCKPFLAADNKTVEETIDYIRCMTLTQNVNPLIYNCLTKENIQAINQYIEAPMTATTIRELKTGPRSNEQVTSELIYYWMIALNIPFECQKWHLNRLLTLIRVCNVKTQPSKKMSKDEVRRRNASLNAARKKKYHTRG